ncbi:MAG: NnrS family protein [Pseudomonadota bacterium]
MPPAPRIPLPVFSAGFRVFFLAASAFAAVAVPLWMAVRLDGVALTGPFAPRDWHIHEMLFGYGSAVLAGFLFTAIPNWTGSLPKSGRPLMALAGLWLAGRLAVGWGLGLPPIAIMALDCAFLLALTTLAGIEIFAGRTWGNVKLLVPVTGFLVANVTFHAGNIRGMGSEIGTRLGFAMLAVMILLIGGRIIPSFTRNWLAKLPPGPMPVPFNRFDGTSLVMAAGALVLWVGLPDGALTGTALLVAAGVQAVRLARWQGVRTGRNRLLLMLHLAFAALILGLFATGLAAFGPALHATGAHLLGIGGIGGMTVAVMMRASLGHTGRALQAGVPLTAPFALILLAAIARTALPGEVALWLAAILWTLGFVLFLSRIGPALWQANPAKRRPN